MQHRLDAAADEGEHDDVVLLLAHGAQELDGGDLADPAGFHADVADLGELACGGSGPSAQQESADFDRALREGFPARDGEPARGERTPFPSGVGICEDGHPERRGIDGSFGGCGRIIGTRGHVLEGRKPFR